MEMLTLADHFSNQWETLLFAAFMIMEALFLVLFGINVLEYRRTVWKHRILPDAVSHSLDHEPEKGTMTLLLAYAVLTAVVTVGTVLLFLFQPHLY